MRSKRGELVVFSMVAFAIIASAIISGSYLILNEQNNDAVVSGSVVYNGQNNYVGDITTNTFYNISCLSHINPENRIIFDSYEKAEKLNFTYGSCLK